MRNLLLLTKCIYQDWFRAKEGYILSLIFFEETMFSEQKGLQSKPFISTRWCYNFFQAGNTFLQELEIQNIFLIGDPICARFGEFVKETYGAKTFWWRLIWAQRVKVALGNDAFCHLHTYPSWCLKASCSPFSLLFQNAALNHCQMYVCQEWNLSIKKWHRVSIIMETYLPHSPTLSTQGQFKTWLFSKAFTTLAHVDHTFLEFPWHCYFCLSLGLSEVALQYYFTISI